MFNNNKKRVVEHLLISGGDTTNINDSVKVKKNFENNQKINRSMTVDSLSKIFNNVASDVIQKNSVLAAAAIGASNTIFISGVKCETVRISGNKQLSTAELELQVKTQQANTSKVSTEISTGINKTIEKIGGTDLAALQAENTKQLNDYMSAMPGYDPNKAQKLASKCPSGGGLISAANSCNVNTSYELDGSVKQALDLDESFKINDNDDISNDIKNKIEQSNFSSCQANATAQNAIIIQDIMCTVNNAAIDADKASKRGGTFEFEDNEQTAVAKLFMTCIFDQKSVNEISNKIMNTIAKRYNQIYDAVEKKALTKGPEYYKKATDLVDLLAASGTEQIQAAAGNLPVRVPNKEIKTETKSNIGTGSEILPEIKSTRSEILPEIKSSGSEILPEIKSTGSEILPEIKSTGSTDSVKNLSTEETKQKQVQDEVTKVITEQDKLAKDMIDAKQTDETDQGIKTYTWFAIGGGILLIIIILIVVFMIRSRKSSDSMLEDYDDDE